MKKIKSLLLLFALATALNGMQTALYAQNETKETIIKKNISTLEISMLPFDSSLTSAEIEFNSAAEYIKKQEYTTAIELLNRAIELDQGMSKASYNAGLCFCQLGMDHNALNRFKGAIDKNPAYLDAYHNCIVIFDRTGNYKEAAEMAENAIGLSNKLKLNCRAEIYKKALETIKTKYNEEKKVELKKKYGEKEMAEILKKMRKEIDEVADSVKYEDKNSPEYRNIDSFHLAVKKFKNSSKPTLLLKIQRSGNEILGIQGYTIKTDDDKFEIKLGWNDLITDFNIGRMAESYTCLITNENANMIKSIAKSKKVIVRYHGRQFYDDKTISAKEMKAFHDSVNKFV